MLFFHKYIYIYMALSLTIYKGLYIIILLGKEKEKKL